jgi:hypothetical protein
VNFLLHHHLAARDLGSPSAAAAAMLPDLWRMADRKVRPAHRRPPLESGAEGRLSEALAGIAHHLAADRWFHAAPVFIEGERRAGGALREAGLAAPRIGLFAHILWELCLDGELVRREGLDQVLAALREGFAALSGGAADRAVELHHFGRVERGAAARELFDQRMGRIFAELERGPWIDGYQHGRGIASRIEGVRVHLGLPRFTEEDHGRLGEVADLLLEQAREAVGAILSTPREELTLLKGASG